MEQQQRNRTYPNQKQTRKTTMTIALFIQTCSSRTSSVPLPSRLCLQILFLHRFATLDTRENKTLALPSLQSIPSPQIRSVRPHQRSDPGLHIPLQRQRGVFPLGHLARDVRDLVLGLLVAQLDDPWGGAFGVGFCGLLLGFAFEFGFRGLDAFWGGVDVGVLVPGRRRRGDNRIPDDRFGGRDGGGVGGRVGGGDVEEDLLCVPVEQARQICTLRSAYIPSAATVS